MERLWLNSYPAHVPAEIDPAQYTSIVDLFQHSVERFHDRPAFQNMGKILSYHEVDELSREFAAYLIHETDLQAGDRIALMMPNLLQYPVALFGALCVVPFVHGAHQVTGNPPDAFKTHAFAGLFLSLMFGHFELLLQCLKKYRDLRHSPKPPALRQRGFISPKRAKVFIKKGVSRPCQGGGSAL